MPDREKHPTDEQQAARALSRWENEGGAKRRRPNHAARAPGGGVRLAKRSPPAFHKAEQR